MPPNHSADDLSVGSREESVDLEGIAARLEAMNRRLEGLEDTVDRFEALADQVPAMAAMVTDIVDRWAERTDGDGVAVDRRVRGVAVLAMKLSDPEVLDALHMLADRGDRLREGIEALDQLPGLLAMVTDTVDRIVIGLEERGVEPDKILGGIVDAAEKFGEFIQNGGLQRLFESGILDANAVRVVGNLGDALAQTSREEAETTGFFGLMGAMRRTDIRRSVNFLVRFGRHFGHSLKESVAKARAELPE